MGKNIAPTFSVMPTSTLRHGVPWRKYLIEPMKISILAGFPHGDCDTVARLGGDEFVVILEGLHLSSSEAAENKNPDEAVAEVEAIAKKILA